MEIGHALGRYSVGIVHAECRGGMQGGRESRQQGHPVAASPRHIQGQGGGERASGGHTPIQSAMTTHQLGIGVTQHCHACPFISLYACCTQPISKVHCPSVPYTCIIEHANILSLNTNTCTPDHILEGTPARPIITVRPVPLSDHHLKPNCNSPPQAVVQELQCNTRLHKAPLPLRLVYPT